MISFLNTFDLPQINQEQTNIRDSPLTHKDLMANNKAPMITEKKTKLAISVCQSSSNQTKIQLFQT